MTAPDFVWVGYRGVFVEKDDRDDVQYVRRDPAVLAALPEVQALVAAALEIAAKLAEPMIGSPATEPVTIHNLPDAILALTPADAKAALDRMLQDARDKALRQAAEIAENALVLESERLVRRLL